MIIELEIDCEEKNEPQPRRAPAEARDRGQPRARHLGQRDQARLRDRLANHRRAAVMSRTNAPRGALYPANCRAVRSALCTRSGM